MKLLVIDIETTGLNPLEDQIIEFAAIAVDTDPNCPIQRFQCLVKHTKYMGHPMALAMNAAILKELAVAATSSEQCIIAWDRFAEIFAKWLRQVELWEAGEVITLCGKNVGTFDLQFLKQVPYWDQWLSECNLSIGHRTFDIGMLFWELGDNSIPAFPLCKERAKMKITEMSHRAMDDCLDVITCLRYALSKRQHDALRLKRISEQLDNLNLSE